MDPELIRSFGAPLLSAILGGLIVHFAARRRDLENDRRQQRIEYLINAYRVLVQSGHRELKNERAEAFENAISDVILLGNEAQIDLARKLMKAFAQEQGAPIDELLVSLRGALRRELGLPSGKLSEVPTIRIVTSSTTRPAPLKLRDAAEVRFEEVSALTAKTVLSATSKIIPGDRRPGTDTGGRTDHAHVDVGPLRQLASTDPNRAITAAYDTVSTALLHLLSNEGGHSEIRPLSELAAEAGQRGLVSLEFVKTAQGLEVLRDLAVTDPRSHTNGQHANEYLDLVTAALYVISSSPT